MATLDAPIVEVTVFTDRARITRRGTARLTAGEQTLLIDNLPISVQEDSVRASGRGADVRILGVEVTQRTLTEVPEEELSTLRKKLEELLDQDKALSDEETSEDARLDFIRALRTNSSESLPRGIARDQANMEDLLALAQYLSNETTAALVRKRELAQKRRELAREIESARARLNRPFDTLVRKQIGVTVEAAADSTMELDVTYTVAGASWAPLYDVRLVANKVSLTYLANVSQRTGEDWPAVKLTLSTARPAVSTTIPELDPWFIDQYSPPVYRPMRMAAAVPAGGMPMAAPAPAPQAMSDTTAFEAAPPPVAKTAVAEVESTGAAVTYRVDRPVAVPSDGSPHKTTVTTVDLEAKLDYVTVPKLAEEAYLRARIKNTSPLILLPGSANIFHGDDFVGRTYLETVVPNEEFEAQLGVDDRVKVERKLSERTAGKALIGNTKRTGLGYKVTVTSHLAWPTIVTVYDQIPVSRHEQIKVRLVEVLPPPTEQTDLQILKWEFDLAPEAKQEISFSFIVEQPRDMKVTGMVE